MCLSLGATLYPGHSLSEKDMYSHPIFGRNFHEYPGLEVADISTDSELHLPKLGWTET